jgi:hypothetical protein
MLWGVLCHTAPVGVGVLGHPRVAAAAPGNVPSSDPQGPGRELAALTQQVLLTA